MRWVGDRNTAAALAKVEVRKSSRAQACKPILKRMGRGASPQSAQAAAAAPPVRGSKERVRALLAAEPLAGHKVAALHLVGSHAYGLATPTSDEDLRGYYIAPTDQLLGMSQPAEQLERKTPDLVVYELGKFARLAAAANPNVLEVLWAPALHLSEEGRLLIEHRHLFLSQRVRHTYGGFARSQLKQLAKADGQDAERREKCARHLFRICEHAEQLLRDGELSIRVRDPEELREKSRWPTDRIEREFARFDDRLAQIASPLPEHPDVEAINRLLVEIRRANL